MTLTLLEDHYQDAENGYNYSFLSAVDMETGEILASSDNYSLYTNHYDLHGAYRAPFIMQLESQGHTITNKRDND